MGDQNRTRGDVASEGWHICVLTTTKCFQEAKMGEGEMRKAIDREADKNIEKNTRRKIEQHERRG
jgi:hypothetical protein